MSHFRLLKDPDTYVAHDWDLLADEPARQYWLKHFEDGFAHSMRFAAEHHGREAEKRIRDATEAFSQAIEALRSNPTVLPSGKLDVLELDCLRDRTLREHELRDPYATAKSEANAAAAELYPPVVRKLHAMKDDAKWLHLVECTFAGNLFDMGSTGETPLAGGTPEDFLQAVENTKPRPWLVDHYDRLADNLLGAVPLKWGKAVVFIDNAGPDFILGVMPLVRELALHGTQIVLAANEGPALNDMTVDETIDVVEQLAAADPDLAALIRADMFMVVSTGATIPLLDLSDVADELNEAAEDADLVLLEGMGRAVETNFDAAFTVDSLQLALLKNHQIAARLGGEMYDCICKYKTVDSA